MPLRRLGAALLTTLFVLGCSEAVQRRLPDGLTANQRLDVELFELFLRFAQDSLGGPLLVDPTLSSAARPTIGVEPDGSRADPAVTTEARRAVVRRLGLTETDDMLVRACRAESALSRGAPDVGSCPARDEVRIGIGPITTYVQSGQPPMAEGTLYAMIGIMRAGPRGKIYQVDELMFATGSDGWRVVGRRMVERVE